MKSNKLGHVMSFSRMFSFIAFLTATFAWVLSMYALFTVSVVALFVSGLLYLNDKFGHHPKGSTKKRALRRSLSFKLLHSTNITLSVRFSLLSLFIPKVTSRSRIQGEVTWDRDDFLPIFAFGDITSLTPSVYERRKKATVFNSKQWLSCLP